MKTMKDYEVLAKAWDVSEKDAKKYIEQGTSVFSDFEENLEGYIKEWEYCYDEEDIEELRQMVETKTPKGGWEIFEDENGHFYYINRCL